MKCGKMIDNSVNIKLMKHKQYHAISYDKGSENKCDVLLSILKLF